MDYISGAGAVSQNDEFKRPGYFRKMAYPEYYKVSEMSITKFERNIRGEQLKYTFINAFPKSMTAIPVAYGPAELLKVTVMFNFDRYIMIPRRATGIKDEPLSSKNKTTETLSTLEYFNNMSKEEKDYYNQRYGQDPQ